MISAREGWRELLDERIAELEDRVAVIPSGWEPWPTWAIRAYDQKHLLDLKAMYNQTLALPPQPSPNELSANGH